MGEARDLAGEITRAVAADFERVARDVFGQDDAPTIVDDPARRENGDEAGAVADGETVVVRVVEDLQTHELEKKDEDGDEHAAREDREPPEVADFFR